MQAELGMPRKKSFYQRHILPALRRLWRGRQQSVWDVELISDEVEDDDDGTYNPGGMVGIVLILGLAQAILLLLPVAYIVQIVFVTPGGLIGIIGRQLADVCLSGGSCDIGQLLASYAFAVIFLFNAVALITYGTLAGAGVFDKPGHPNDLPFAVAVVDEHVRELHDELITAKVLPAPIEADDDQ